MSTVRRERGAAGWVALLAIVVAAGAALLWRQEPAGPSAGETPPPARAADPVADKRLELVTATGVHALEVEIAATPEQQSVGLMFRTHLADDKGMLFTHPEPRELTMWMRNTYIPLDMVFIRADGTVHRIEARTEPLSERVIASKGPVSAVLEIAGGNAARLGLKAGDRVVHPAFRAPSSPAP